MSRGVNKVIIVGNLGDDPESRHTPNGAMVVNIRVATSESWKDKNTGEKQERTEWHRISAFGKLAEIMNQYLTKGSQVYIEGKLRTDSYEKDGQKRYATTIVANEMQMLGGRGNGSQAAQAPARAPQAATVGAGPDISFDDDVPF